MIIESVIGNMKDYPVSGRRVDKVVLDRDGLSRPHQKVRTQEGEVFALSLPHGAALSPGDIIFADAERVVAVELSPEDALVIRPAGQMQWARAAYNIGNMHQRAFIQEDCIVTPYDNILEGIMQKLQVPCERAVCPIDGVRANVSQTEGHHHHHGHGHDHSHEHDHSHSHEHSFGQGGGDE